MIDMSEETKINDGKGLYDSDGLIDSLILDCNALPKDLFSGMNVQFCNRIVQIAQKLTVLRDGIKKEKDSLLEQIEDKQRFIDELQATLYNVKINRAGDDNNGRTAVNIE